MRTLIAILGALATLAAALASLIGAISPGSQEKSVTKNDRSTPTSIPQVVQSGNTGITIAGSNNTIMTPANTNQARISFPRIEGNFSVTDSNYDQGQDDRYPLFVALLQNEGGYVALNLGVWYNFILSASRSKEDVLRLVSDCSDGNVEKIDSGRLHRVTLSPVVKLPDQNLGCSHSAIRCHFLRPDRSEELVWAGSGIRYFRIRGVFEVQLRPQLGRSIFELRELKLTDSERAAALQPAAR